MSSIVKSSGSLLAFAFILGLPPYSAAAVYTCPSASGGKTYTSERAPACKTDDLPRISGYQGGGYRLKAAKTKAKPEAGSKTRKTKAKPARQNRRIKRAAEQAEPNGRPSEKGRGYSAFPATGR